MFTVVAPFVGSLAPFLPSSRFREALREPLREIGPVAASLFVLSAWHSQESWETGGWMAQGPIGRQCC